MAKKDVRVMITLECTTGECKSRNYTMTKNKRLHTGRVEYKKYCPPCNKRTVHKETR
ncbi:MAG: 50S ribosomal protein L33 [Calditrichaeota bacterium]|nr:MAG: 50S ribosomal protein L33 [Calditrichota bacterium]